MSWQEELRKLDEELAAGRLSADDYRVRRDQVLSSAVTHGDDAAGAAQAQAQGQAPGQQAAQPGQPPQPAQPQQPGQPDPAQAAQQQPQAQAPQQPQAPQPQTPQAPAQQAQPQQQNPQAPQQQAPQQQAPQPPENQNQGGDGNLTQVIAPVTPPPGQAGQPPQTAQPPQAAQPGGDPEATQAVRPSDPEATQAVRPGDAEATQAVQPVAPPQPPYQPQASPAAGFPQPAQQQQQPWNAPEVDQSPPWGGEFPPVSPGNSADWGQGPEDSFESESKGGKGKIFAILGAVVLLAGIATGAFFLFGSGDGDNQAGGGNQGQQGGGNSSSQAPPPQDDMPLEGQEGELEDSASLDSWDDIASINLLTDDESSAYQSAGPGEAEYAVYRHDGGKVKTVVLMVKVADQDAASAAVGELRDIQLKNNQKNTSVNGVPGSVQVTGIQQKKDKGKIVQPATMRAHYLSGDVLVRIEGWSGEEKLDAIRDKFEATLKTQLDNLPADE